MICDTTRKRTSSPLDYDDDSANVLSESVSSPIGDRICSTDTAPCEVPCGVEDRAYWGLDTRKCRIGNFYTNFYISTNGCLPLRGYDFSFSLRNICVVSRGRTALGPA